MATAPAAAVAVGGAFGSPLPCPDAVALPRAVAGTARALLGVEMGPPPAHVRGGAAAPALREALGLAAAAAPAPITAARAVRAARARREAVLAAAVRAGDLSWFSCAFAGPTSAAWRALLVDALWQAVAAGHVELAHAALAPDAAAHGHAGLALAVRQSCEAAVAERRLPLAVLAQVLNATAGVAEVEAGLPRRVLAQACGRAVARGDLDALRLLEGYAGAQIDWHEASLRALARGDAEAGGWLARRAGADAGPGPRPAAEAEADVEGSRGRLRRGTQVVSRAIDADAPAGIALGLEMLAGVSPVMHAQLMARYFAVAYAHGRLAAAAALVAAGGPALVSGWMAAALEPDAPFSAAAARFWAGVLAPVPDLAARFWAAVAPHALARHARDPDVVLAVVEAMGPLAALHAVGPGLRPVLLGHALLRAHAQVTTLCLVCAPAVRAVALAQALTLAVEADDDAATARLDALWDAGYALADLACAAPRDLRAMAAAALAAGRPQLLRGWEARLDAGALAALARDLAAAPERAGDQGGTASA